MYYNFVQNMKSFSWKGMVGLKNSGGGFIGLLSEKNKEYIYVWYYVVYIVERSFNEGKCGGDRHLSPKSFWNI